MSDSPTPGKVNDEELIGELFDGKYRITAKLGGGGMGLVYEAQHEWMERRVALKVLRPNFIHAEDYEIFLERFKREAQTASRITHPNAVTIYDFGIYKQMPYLAMQFIEGRTISEIIKAEGPMSEERATTLIRQVLDAVAAAHALQIVHRDIKPDNIMLSIVDSRENVHVLDFGIAKVLDSSSEANATMTQPGKAVGTPRYMSPEQVLARPIDARTDIYALGLVLYEMLSGDIPFKADSSMQLMFHHVNTAPLPIREVNAVANVSKGLEKLIMKALQKDADKRYQSVEEMQQALEALKNRPTRRTSVTLPSVPTLTPARGKTLLFTTASIVVLALLLTIIAVWKRQATEEQESPQLAALPAPAADDTDALPSANADGEDQIKVTEAERVELGTSVDTTSVEAGEPKTELSAGVANESAAEVEVSVETEAGEDVGDTGAANTPATALETAAETSPSVADEEEVEGSGTAEQERNAADSGGSPDTETVDSETADSETARNTTGVAPEIDTEESAAEIVAGSDSRVAEQIEHVEVATASDTIAETTADPDAEETMQGAEAEAQVAPSAASTDGAQENTVAKRVEAPDTEAAEAQPAEGRTASTTPEAKAPQSTAALIAQLAAEDRTVRENATVALQQRGKEPVPLLIQTLRTHESPRARFLAVFILGKLRATEATDAIVDALRDDSPMVQETAKKALLAVNPARAEKVLGLRAPAATENRKESDREGLFGLF